MSDGLSFRRREFKGGDGEFRTAEAWRSCMRAHADAVVPRSAWDGRLPARDSWFVPIIRAAKIAAVSVEPTHA